MKRIVLCLLITALLLCAACSPSVSSESPEPRVTTMHDTEVYIIEPRFTIETVPEYGNTKRYIELLYQSREAVAEALSMDMGTEYYFYMPEYETLWERDFFIMLDFENLHEKPDEHLWSVTYALKVPSDMIESEAEFVLSAITELYGEPDERDARLGKGTNTQSVKRWTLDKHIEETAGSVYSPQIMRGAEGVAIMLEFHTSTLSRLRPEDIGDKDARYISLIYKLNPYTPVIQFKESE